MHYILGIDQGGTKTHAVVCDERGRLLSLGMGPGANYAANGMPTAMNAVLQAAESALTHAALTREQITFVFAGMTSADWPDEYSLLQHNLDGLELGAEVQVTNDCIIALRGGTHTNFGAIVAAGTGTNCALRAPNGATFIYHYYVDDDLQGGIALGRRALTAIYRAATGREPATLLTAQVLELFNMTSVDELLRAHGERHVHPGMMGQIAPLVSQAAYVGDAVAAQLLTSFGTGLAELVTAGLRRLEMTALAVEVVLSGSIFKGPGSLLADVMRAQIHAVAPKACLINARYEPVVGAALLGLEKLGIPFDAQLLATLEQSSQQLGLIRQIG